MRDEAVRDVPARGPRRLRPLYGAPRRHPEAAPVFHGAARRVGALPGDVGSGAPAPGPGLP